MKVTNENSGLQIGESRAPEAETTEAANNGLAPRNLTFSQNLMLTIKLVAGTALLLAALWGLELWRTSGAG